MTATYQLDAAIEASSERLWQRALAALGDDMRPCVLHQIRSSDGAVESDVDCFLPHHLIPSLVARRLRGAGIAVVNHIRHEATSHCLVLTERDGEGGRVILRLDLTSDFRYSRRPLMGGRVFLAEDELARSRRPGGAFTVPVPAVEFGYCLLKRIAKGRLTVAHGERLTELFREDPTGCEAMLSRFWPRPSRLLLRAAAETGDWRPAVDAVPDLRADLLSQSARSAPWNVAAYLVRDGIRLLDRVLRPAGLQVVLLGADGSGKSTVAQAVAAALAPAFAGTSVAHLRPRLVARSRQVGDASDPYGLAPRRLMPSLAKALFWLVDYSVGYALRVRPDLVRGRLVLFDRYFVDVLADPKRYRYGGPAWLLRLMRRLMPGPDLTVLLDAPAEVLQQRKREVSLDETAHQRAAYRSLVQGMANAVIVDAAQPHELVVADVTDAILAHLAGRTARRLRLPDRR